MRKKGASRRILNAKSNWLRHDQSATIARDKWFLAIAGSFLMRGLKLIIGKELFFR